MANTYTLIASSTVGAGGVSTITFSSIPSTYTDLVLKLSTRESGSNAVWDNIFMTFNSAATNYKTRVLYATGSSPTSTSSSNSDTVLRYTFQDDSTATANVFANAEYYIPNYAGSSNKSISSDSVVENNGATGMTALTAGLWSDTSAITSISFTCGNGNFVQYSTAYLYGIKNS